MIPSRLLTLALFAVLPPVAAAQSAPTSNQTPGVKRFQVRTADGLNISAQEWGNPKGPEILFIHAFSQSQLSWSRQVQSQLARDFRLVTYDLRGHGESDKPLGASFYEGRDWGEEVHAVMRAAHLKRPVVVAWSYGGRVLNEYLKLYGDRNLAGIDYVSAITRGGAGVFGPGAGVGQGMSSTELPVNIAATQAEVRALTFRPMDADDLETTLAFNMVVPPQVRAHMSAGIPAGTDYDAVLRKLRVPVLVTHGEGDTIATVAMAWYTVSTVPGAKLSLYPDVGHFVAYEDAPRFNRELADFTRSAPRVGRPAHLASGPQRP